LYDVNTAADEVAREVRMAVGHLARQLRRLYSQAQGTEQVSFLELAVLVRLERDGPTTVGTLAAGERVTGQAVSAALASLRSRRFVDRIPDPLDRRRVQVSMNSAGRAVLDGRDQIVEGVMKKATREAFSDEELRCLKVAAALLERLAEVL
jgi:DNA-binding MarR family transcriptional regulator